MPPLPPPPPPELSSLGELRMLDRSMVMRHLRAELGGVEPQGVSVNSNHSQLFGALGTHHRGRHCSPRADAWRYNERPIEMLIGNSRMYAIASYRFQKWL